MAEPVLLLNRGDHTATIVLNRPDSYNALSEELLDALADALDEVAADENIKIAILAANGKAFCAGHDLKQMRANDEYEYQHALFEKCSAVMQKLIKLPQPIIARVHGMATAAGCQLVASCDLAVASTDAQFAVSGVRVGLFCSTPAVALARNIARKSALQMLLTGEFINAETAAQYGLINKVVAGRELDAAVNELSDKIATYPTRVIRLGKQRFYQQLEKGLSDAYTAAAETMAENMMLGEAREGIDAFIQKRKPNWQ